MSNWNKYFQIVFILVWVISLFLIYQNTRVGKSIDEILTGIQKDVHQLTSNQSNLSKDNPSDNQNVNTTSSITTSIITTKSSQTTASNLGVTTTTLPSTTKSTPTTPPITTPTTSTITSSSAPSFDTFSNVVTDDFSDPATGRWNTQISTAAIDLGYVTTGGQSYYHMYLKNQNNLFLYGPFYWPQYTDFMLQTNAIIDPPNVDGSSALFFRWAQGGKNGYAFLVSGLGKYALIKFVNDVQVYIVPWTESPLIKTGTNQVNQLLIVCKGSQINGYINGKLAVNTIDSTFTQGYVLMGAFTYTQNNIDFHYFLSLSGGK